MYPGVLTGHPNARIALGKPHVEDDFMRTSATGIPTLYAFHPSPHRLGTISFLADPMRRESVADESPNHLRPSDPCEFRQVLHLGLEVLRESDLDDRPDCGAAAFGWFFHSVFLRVAGKPMWAGTTGWAVDSLKRQIEGRGARSVYQSVSYS